MTARDFQMSMGDGDHLQSGVPSARLPSTRYYKNDDDDDDDPSDRFRPWRPLLLLISWALVHPKMAYVADLRSALSCTVRAREHAAYIIIVSGSGWTGL